MRAVIQRVASASVAVDNEVISRISKGLMVLVGIGTGKSYRSKLNSADDTEADIAAITNKIVNLRVFNDPADSNKMWKSSVKDIDGEVLCVSQFTLLGNTTKGNKPDFHKAMSAEPGRIMYTTFLERLGQAYKPEKIKDGKFGAMMDVSLTNEGPVTFTIDSRKFEYVDPPLAKSVKTVKGSSTSQNREKSAHPDSSSEITREGNNTES